MNILGQTFGESAPLGSGVTVVEADAHGLVALCKPAGTLSHPNKPGEESRSLLNAPYTLAGEYYQWKQSDGSSGRAWLLNRLDSATSGIVLLARSQALADHVRAQFKSRAVLKVYAALVFGQPSPRSGVWRDRLAVQKAAGKIRTGTTGNVPAESAMHWVQSNQRLQPMISLIQLTPKTGRSHQLRVQCAKRRLPIVGDATYGEFKLNRAFAREQGSKRLFLHSFRTAFDYDWAGKRNRFEAEAPLPAAFSAALTS